MVRTTLGADFQFFEVALSFSVVSLTLKESGHHLWNFSSWEMEGRRVLDSSLQNGFLLLRGSVSGYSFSPTTNVGCSDGGWLLG